MLVVMHSHATPAQIDQVVRAIRDMNLTPHPLPGAMRTAIGITGNIGAVDPRTLEVIERNWPLAADRIGQYPGPHANC
jgi:3-deoxy-7-phosphoheptulonate synthase